MDNGIQEKIELISNIHSDDASFVVKVLKAFQEKQREMIQRKKMTSIITEKNKIEPNKTIIDLDKIWAKPYFYTRMRRRLEGLVNEIIKTDDDEIIKNSSKLLKKVIYNNTIKNFEKPTDETDIIEFIKNLDNKKIDDNFDFIFIAEKVDEETIFKEEQIKTALKIIRTNDIKERYSIIYDEICNYLDKDFVQNQYCDFKNNKCIAQRKHKLYPPNRKNGCCSMQIRKCPNLINGNCTVACIPCKLFSCKYLEKRGIGYWGKEIILLQAFLNKKQRKHFVFDFYQDKDTILKKVYDDYT